MPAAHIGPREAFALVLGGGAVGWLLQMLPGLWQPRGPERRAVAAAARAVAGFIAAAGSAKEGVARQQAAIALHEAWHALVSHQSAQVAPDDALARLRRRNRALHVLFSEAAECAAHGRPMADDAQARARALGDPATDLPGDSDAAAQGDMPLDHPGPADALRDALRLRSMSMLVVGRVGLAAVVAGAIGSALELERAYWVIAAAVLMLHQGLEWMPLVQRSLERLLGTWAGLLLAAAVLWVFPQGPWLAATILVLQFTIEMLVMRNYALAVVFITAAAMTLATGGQPVPDLGGYLLARGVDTAVGCAVALVVYRLTWPNASAAQVPDQLARTCGAIERLAVHLAAGEVATKQARKARRDLQHRTFALLQAWERAMAATRRPRRSAERWWPAITAAEQAAYRMLNACWAIERLGGDAGRAAAAAMFGEDGLPALRRALASVRAQIAGQPQVQETPADVDPEQLPDFLRTELPQLHRGLPRG